MTFFQPNSIVRRTRSESPQPGREPDAPVPTRPAARVPLHVRPKRRPADAQEAPLHDTRAGRQRALPVHRRYTVHWQEKRHLVHAGSAHGIQGTCFG